MQSVVWATVIGFVLAPSIGLARTVCETQWRQVQVSPFAVEYVPLQTCREVPDPPVDPAANLRTMSEFCDLLIKAYGEEKGRAMCQALIEHVGKAAANP